jgi:hypothetical protein
MSYRITITEKWKDDWFNSLSPNAKLLFLFLVDNCNNAGFYDVRRKFLLFYIGLNDKELDEAIIQLKKTYIKSNDGSRIWIKNFIKHQKKYPLNYSNNNHKQIIGLIQENLNDESKFKGCNQLNAMLPADMQVGKRKKREVSEKNDLSDIEPSTIIPLPKFVKPTIEEIAEQMKSKDFAYYIAESSRFYNYFESQGWKVGKNTMKSWKGAVHTWISNFYERNKMHEKKSKIETLREAHEELIEVDWNEVYKLNGDE